LVAESQENEARGSQRPTKGLLEATLLPIEMLRLAATAFAWQGDGAPWLH